MKPYHTYLLASRSRVLYVGVTGDLERRIFEHKQKLVPGFAARYNVKRLVYFEETSEVTAAIAREKQLKGWTRAKKIALLESVNPEWRDLSEDWGQKRVGQKAFTLNEQLLLCHPERSEGSSYAQGRERLR